MVAKPSEEFPPRDAAEIVDVSEIKGRARRDASPIRLSACAASAVFGCPSFAPVRTCCMNVRTPSDWASSLIFPKMGLF